MNLENQKKLTKQIYRLLKVNEIVFPIGRTNKGNLGIKFSESSDDFEIYLDAVPLSVKDWDKDENNIELKKVLEKYLFDEKTVTSFKWSGQRVANTANSAVDVKETNLATLYVNKTSETPKRRGRPAGSKNKK